MATASHEFTRALRNRGRWRAWLWRLAHWRNRECMLWAEQVTGIPISSPNVSYWRNRHAGEIDAFKGQPDPDDTDPPPHPQCRARHCCEHTHRSEAA